MSETQFTSQAEQAKRQEQDIQADLEAREADKRPQEDKVIQTGARPYPVPPFPEQHQSKPGIEAEIEPRPMYDAPYWKGSGKLQDKVALITGADSGIGR